MNKSPVSTLPIFIHSMFRAGSTYIFEQFCHSGPAYWGYQEPLHEHIRFLDKNKDADLDISRKSSEELRHPLSSHPYFVEYLSDADEIRSAFRKSFSYDDYFLNEKVSHHALERYLALLINRAQERPVLQFCRSSGRMEWLRAHFDAVHLFLWRNPWDQWWSYKVTPYFDVTNLLILNSASATAEVAAVRAKIGMPEFHREDVREEIEYFSKVRLTNEQNYFVFFSLWAMAYLAGRKNCDCVISMDRLAESPEYRSEIYACLASYGIRDISLENCETPLSYYSSDELGWFSKIEQDVLKLLVEHGYAADASRALQECLSGCAARSAERLQFSVKMAADLARWRGMGIASQGQLRNCLIQAIEATESARSLESALHDARADLQMLRTSYVCRVYRAVRKMLQ